MIPQAARTINRARIFRIRRRRDVIKPTPKTIGYNPIGVIAYETFEIEDTAETLRTQRSETEGTVFSVRLAVAAPFTRRERCSLDGAATSGSFLPPSAPCAP